MRCKGHQYGLPNMSSRRQFLSLMRFCTFFWSSLNQMTRVMIVIITSNMLFMFYTLNVLFSSQKYGKTFICASFLWGKTRFFGWGAAFFHSACKKIYSPSKNFYSPCRKFCSASRFSCVAGAVQGARGKGSFSGFLWGGGEVVVMRRPSCKRGESG